MSERYLVTGGCGFIGSHLVDALIAGGSEVVVLDNLSTGHRKNLNPAARLVIGDISDHAVLIEASAGCAGIFHLAAIASVPKCTEHWHESHKVNLSASVDVFETAATRGIPVVYASSSAVYGDTVRTPISEDTPKQPISAYGVDKYAMELHAAAGARTRGLRSFGLRFFNIYGPRQDPRSPYSGVLAIFMRNAREGMPITIHGDGQQIRDFVYVADAVTACLAAMHKLRGQSTATAEVCNVCIGQGTSIRTLAEAVSHAVGSDLEISHGPARAGDILTSIGDPTKLANTLGIKAAVGILDGIRHLHLASPAQEAATGD